MRISTGGADGLRAMMSPAIAVLLLIDSGVKSVPLPLLAYGPVQREGRKGAYSSLTLPEMNGILANFPCSSS